MASLRRAAVLLADAAEVLRLHVGHRPTADQPASAFRDPEVGRMTLTYEVMRLARTGGRRMVVYQAAPGTPDEAAMLRLELTATRSEPEAPGAQPFLRDSAIRRATCAGVRCVVSMTSASPCSQVRAASA